VEEDPGRFPGNLVHPSSPGEKGRVRIGNLLLLLLLAIGVYLGAQVISAYVDYLSLSEAVRLVVRDVHMTPERMEQGEERILAKAQELQLPVSKMQVVLTVDPDRIVARVRWQQPIGLFGFTIPLSLEIEDSKSLR
ncbi:MAG: hypothetical protein V3U33_08440, partial [candidate division NC10 bacterium]